MHINTALNREQEITLLVNFCSPVYNQHVRYIVEIDGPHGPPVEECPGFYEQSKLKHVISMLASPKAFMQRAVIPSNTRHVMITFPLLACMHDWLGQARKQQK